MDKKRVGRPKTQRENSPPASRTRSKSPARTTSSGRDSAPLKRGRVKKTETPSEEISSSSQSSTPKKQLRPKKEKLTSGNDSDDNEEVAKINSNEVRRRSNRLQGQAKATPTPTSESAKRSVSRATSSLTKEDSDDEEAKPVDIGIYSKAWTHVVIFILLLTLPILIHLIAAAGGWKWDKIVALVQNPSNFLSIPVILIGAGIHLGISLISLLPFGRIVTISDRTYKFNGILSAVIILSIIIGFELKNGSTFSLFFANLDKFLIFALITAIQASNVSYLLSKYKPSSVENSYGQTGKLPIDFVAGRELNPAAFNRVDIKRVLNNESIIWLLIINVTLLIKNISIPDPNQIQTASEGSPITELIKATWSNFVFIVQNSEYNAAALVTSGLIIVYALDALIYEHHLSTSFQVNDEGCGAEFFLRSASFPYIFSLLPRFLLVNNVEVDNCGLIVCGLFFILGLVIKRCSNCLKYEYRLKPSDPKFKGNLNLNYFIQIILNYFLLDLTTLPTFQNRRLIISKWFSKIRQPNLLGEIILHLSMLYLLAFTFDLGTCIGIISIIVYLIYRSIGINRKNAIKYESTWKKYVATVKYNLLPRVY